MFAEGKHDNHAEMLTSKDGIDWKWEGQLDVRAADGKTPAKRPCGTPTVWVENGVWYLFYEWNDKGVWLATTTDPQIARLDERAGRAGAEHWARRVRQGYDRGRSGHQAPRRVLRDLSRQRQRHEGAADVEHEYRPLDRSRALEEVSGQPDRGGQQIERHGRAGGGRFRLYTMHDQVDVFER